MSNLFSVKKYLSSCLAVISVTGFFLIGSSSCSRTNNRQRVVKDSVLVTLLKEVSSYDSMGVLVATTRFSYSRFGVIDTLQQWAVGNGFISDSNLYVFTLDSKTGLPDSYIANLVFGFSSQQDTFYLSFSNGMLSKSTLRAIPVNAQNIVFDQQPDLTTMILNRNIPDSLTFSNGNLMEFKTYQFFLTPCVNRFYYSKHKNPYYNPALKPYAALFLSKDFLNSRMNDLWIYFDALSQNLPDSIFFNTIALNNEYNQGTYAFTWTGFNDEDLPLTGYWEYNANTYYTGGYLIGPTHYMEKLGFEYEQVWVSE